MFLNYSWHIFLGGGSTEYMETNAGLRIVGAPLGSKMRRDTYAPTPLHTNCEITGSSSSGNRLGLSARLKHQHSSPEKLVHHTDISTITITYT